MQEKSDASLNPWKAAGNVELEISSRWQRLITQATVLLCICMFEDLGSFQGINYQIKGGQVSVQWTRSVYHKMAFQPRQPDLGARNQN